MEIDYKTNDIVTPGEMQALEESVGFGPYRNLKRNRIAIAGSPFIATACYHRKLIGLVRLVGDGVYILHNAGISVHPDFQKKGVGRKLMEIVLDFCKNIGVGSVDNDGEFTLFANIGTDVFYEKLGFTLVHKGMVLTDTGFRLRHELQFQEEWKKKREQR